jgi:hypothetical protein
LREANLHSVSSSGAVVAKQFAVRLSLIAFATASIHGLLAGSDFEAAVNTSLIAMAAFYALGLVGGELARRLVEETVEMEMARIRAAEHESHS